MKDPTSIYVHCDELDQILALNRDNWNRETEILAQELKPNAHVLQIGCMKPLGYLCIMGALP